MQAPGSAPAARTERAAAPKRASPARAIVPPGPAPDYLYSVRDVLEPFKKGIEQTVTADDSQTHYDLGIAYREMGLHEDAIHEFEVAFQGSHRERRIDCLTMIALCRLDAGDHTGAIEAYRAALGSEGLTDDLRRSVEYQLATAYEAAGDVDAALRSLNGLLAEDPEYRDARARVARLGGGAGRTSAAAVNPADPVAGTTASVRRSR